MRRGDVIGATAFAAVAAANGALAASAALELVAQPNLRHATVTVYALLKAAVVLAFASFMLVRAASSARSRTPIALVACIAAVGGLMAVRGPSTSTDSAVVLAGELVAVAAGAWLLASVVTLGRCFGILPEARGLVTSGPYAVVRHPVYLGEIGICVGLAIAAPSLWNAAVLAVVVAAQGMRMRLEERALADVFPEYRRYAATTPRLVPRVPRAGAVTTPSLNR